ncbi:hypothetical protein IMG5_019570, partial [Ichthyophthirius multifiliis]
IQLFMKEQGRELNKNQLICLFKKIGNEYNINYNQFSELLIPIEQSSMQQQINTTQFCHTSPNNKRKQNVPNSVKFAASQRSPYHTPNKIFGTTSRLQQLLSSQLKNNSNNNKSITNNNIQRRKYMQGNEEEYLVRSLKEFIIIDKDADELKTQLILMPDFNSEDAFRIFDKKGKGFVSKIELEINLNDIGIYPTKEEMILFFKRFDRDNDGLLKFSDFQYAILPFSEEYKVLGMSKMPNFRNPDDGLANFQVETAVCFKKLINRLFQGEVEGEYIRQKLKKRQFFSIHEAFQTLDYQDNGFITIDDLKNILYEYGIFVSQNDLFLLFQRFNKSQNQRIQYPDFMNELTQKIQ